MKNKGKLIGALLVGILIGGLGVGVYMGFSCRWLMAFYAEVHLLEMSSNARQIRAGGVDEVLARFETAIGREVVTFAKEHRRYVKGDSKYAALWAAQRYYEVHPDVEVSGEVKRILDGLPPQPVRSCELKRKLDDSEQDKPKI